jgi:hypothetical protein
VIQRELVARVGEIGFRGGLQLVGLALGDLARLDAAGERLVALVDQLVLLELQDVGFDAVAVGLGGGLRRTASSRAISKSRSRLRIASVASFGRPVGLAVDQVRAWRRRSSGR